MPGTDRWSAFRYSHLRMAGKKRSIHKNAGRGNGPRSGRTAQLIIDVITDFEFEDGARLHKNLLSIAGNIAKLKRRMRTAGFPVIYVNDNYGKWQEDFRKTVESILANSEMGREIAEQLKPADDDYYILKPQRSAFYETPLDVLLASLDVSRIILTGVTTDICILFTAHDAYMRGLEVLVPSDCTAAVEDAFRDEAIRLLARVVDADVRPASQLRLPRK